MDDLIIKTADRVLASWSVEYLKKTLMDMIENNYKTIYLGTIVKGELRSVTVTPNQLQKYINYRKKL